MPRWMKAAQAGKAREGEPAPPPPAPAAAAPISKEPPAKAPPAAKALADTASEVEPPAPVPARGKRPASGPLAPAGEEDGSDILGADVFEGNISEERPIPVELRGKGGKTASSSRAELPKADKPSTSGRHKTGKKGESERAAASSASSRKTEPAPEARKSSARLEKKTSGRGPAVKADKPEPQVGKAGKAEKAGEAMDSKAKKHSGRRAAVGAPSDVMPALSTPSDTGKTSDSGISLDLGDLTELDDEPGQKPKPKGLPAGLDEAKLRRAFDKAMERAWKAFLEELRG